MKTLLKTFSLLSVLCSQVSLTLYKVSSPLRRDEKSGNNTVNVEFVSLSSHLASLTEHFVLHTSSGLWSNVLLVLVEIS